MSTSESTAAAEALADAELTAPGDADHAVTALELFFDLVFVLAITQVTALLAADPTGHGLLRAVLMLALLWWGWTGYAWLTNAVDVDEGAIRIAYLGAMAAMLVAALAVPTAFTTNELAFAAAYFVFRLLHLVVYERTTRDRPEVNRVVRRLGPTLMISAGLIVVASFFDGPAQLAIWAVAIAIDYGGPLLVGSDGWQVSPGHFVERHGLIIIIALGESIVAIGAGAPHGTISVRVILAAVFGIAAVGALWWLYFDVVAVVAGRRMREATGAARNAMARDSYSYLHLPMVTGIVLLALGLKKALLHPELTLRPVPAIALCGGVALYLIAHIAFRLRNVHSLNRQRVVATVVCLALIPLALHASALASVASISAVLVALIAYEAIRFREARRRVRKLAAEG